MGLGGSATESARVSDEPELDAILAGTGPHLVFKQVRERIFARKAKGPFASYRQQLSAGELMVLLVNGFVWEMDNGGMNQILFNSIGDDAEALRALLRGIGATEAADALDRVSATVFGGGPIPADRKTRAKLVSAWESEDEARAEAFFDAAGVETGPITQAAVAYIRAHREQFS
jgi:hypothetical protein